LGLVILKLWPINFLIGYWFLVVGTYLIPSFVASY